MRVAELAVGDRSYFLRPDEVERVMHDASVARDAGDWLEFHDAGGRTVHVLIPAAAVISLHQYEIEDLDPGSTGEWTTFDYDL
jgi:hypothetical protein